MPRRKTKIEVVERPLGREKALGLAWVGENKIEIDGRLKSKQYLNTLIHEMLHIYNPAWPETRIDQTATEMCNVIWAKNYRRMKR
jgi:hypothetical protein